MELKDYKHQVKEIMREHKQARNSDWTLLAHYISKHRPELVHYTQPDERQKASIVCVPLNKFKYFPSAETLIRARRIIQNEDCILLPTDPEVVKARGIKEKNYREAEVREAVEDKS